MTDDLRRADDALLTGLSGEVALLRQAHELGARATDNALGKLEKSIETLTFKLDSISAGLTEPNASPAGRALQRQIDDHDERLTVLEADADVARDFRTQVNTALRTLRVQLTLIGTVLGVIAGASAVLAAVHYHP